MLTKIICIGNRFQPQDAAALYVYDILCTRDLPAHCNLIEGGLAGLNLLTQLEDGGRIIFVDTVSGFTAPGRTVILTAEQIISTLATTQYDHTAGLPYLLAVLPQVCEGELPTEIIMVGIECCQNCKTTNVDESLTEATDLILQIALIA